MNNVCTFKRTEQKYRINKEEYSKLMKLIKNELMPDIYPNCTVSSLYLDTPDYRIIRSSLQGGIYKEKLRVRYYNDFLKNKNLFLEIKKKFKGVVYKRRIFAPKKSIIEYIYNGIKPEKSQIMNEIDYAFNFYGNLKPSMLISYDRAAFVLKNDKNIRITFDTNIKYQINNISFDNLRSEIPVISPDEVIMEIKSNSAVPIWLSKALNGCKLFPTTFSKYGTAYRNFIDSNTKNTDKGEKNYA